MLPVSPVRWLVAAGEWASEAAWCSLICCSRSEISDCRVGIASFELAKVGDENLPWALV